jgi:hypothetical protein
MSGSVAELIDACGGPSAVGGKLQIPATTIASWKSRGSIPVNYWPDLLGAARESGVELSNDKLVELHAKESAA